MIYFGEYPQTIKAYDVDIYEGTTDARGYYLGSDGEYYAEVIADPYNADAVFTMGAPIEARRIYYFKVEPIRWRILSEEGENALILCDSIITNREYDSNSNNYQYSDIRAWLNDTFLLQAFYARQQQIILASFVDNSDYSTGYDLNRNACEDTVDNIFLLSYRQATDAEYGFSQQEGSGAVRSIPMSDFARASGASGSYQGNGYWWLRSPDETSGNVRGVDSDGNFGEFSADFDAMGVVPAMWIQL